MRYLGGRFADQAGRLVIVALSACGLSTAGVAQGPPDASVLVGVVLADLGQEPVADAVVEIRERARPTNFRRTLTDAAGRFRFSRVSAGTYELSARAAGFWPGRYGQKLLNGPGRPITIPAQEIDLKVRVWRLSTVSGRVLDDLGRPLVACPVQVFGLLDTAIPKLSTPLNGMTDDRGIYRISDVPPGDYLVAVIQTSTTARETGQQLSRPDSTVSFSGSQTAGSLFRVRASVGPEVFLVASSIAPIRQVGNEFVGFGGTFHSGSRTLEDAAAVTLAAGQDVVIDFRLDPVPTFAVGGVLLDETGIALPGVELRLLDRSPSFGFIPIANTVSGVGGKFTFVGIPKGRYGLEVVRSPSGGRGRSQGAETRGRWGNIQVSVPQVSLGDLALAAKPGTFVSGQVTIQDGLSFGGFDWTGRRVEALSLDTGETVSVSTDSTGQFKFPQLADGRYRLGLGPGQVPSGWAVIQVRSQEKDITREALLLAGPSIEVQLVLSNRLATIRGSVTDQTGRVDSDATVLIFPADFQDELTFVDSTWFRSISVDERGTFVAAGLRSGRYLLVAVPSPPPNVWRTSAALRSLVPKATGLDVHNSQSISVNLRTRR